MQRFYPAKKNNPKPANTVSINGTTYSTVKIGTQTWTSVNYNGSGGVNYDGSETNNPTYGKLYTFAEAQDAAKNLPTGWRLPTRADMETLLSFVGATGTSLYGGVLGRSTVCSKLRSTSDWQDNINGNNSSGFNAYPVGNGYPSTYYSLNVSTIFWTNTSDNSNNKYVLYMDYDQTYTILLPNASASNASMSIRFVKDN